MKILVTNDDSIHAKGLMELAKKAKQYGDVVIVAPSEEQSGKSHSINIRSGIILKEHDLGLDVPSYELSSTPADCVRAAYYALKIDFDIVFSGINNGLNLGEDILYSGTVAAITEAATYGKKGIAFSSNTNNYMEVIHHFEEIMDMFFKYDLFSYSLIYNVNVPRNPKGIVFTKQGSTHFDTRFENIEGMYYQKGSPRFERDDENIDSDVRAIYNHYISITPLSFDRTHHDALKIIQGKVIK